MLYKHGTSMHGSWLFKEGYKLKRTLYDACVSDMAILFFQSAKKRVTLTTLSMNACTTPSKDAHIYAF